MSIVLQQTFFTIIANSVKKFAVDKCFRIYYTGIMTNDIHEKYPEPESFPEKSRDETEIEKGLLEPAIEADIEKSKTETTRAAEEGERRLEKEKLEYAMTQGEPSRPDAAEIDTVLKLAETKGVAHALQFAGEKQNRELLEAVIADLITQKKRTAEQILEEATKKMTDPWTLDITKDYLASLKHD